MGLSMILVLDHFIPCCLAEYISCFEVKRVASCCFVLNSHESRMVGSCLYLLFTCLSCFLLLTLKSSLFFFPVEYEIKCVIYASIRLLQPVLELIRYVSFTCAPCQQFNKFLEESWMEVDN